MITGRQLLERLQEMTDDMLDRPLYIGGQSEAQACFCYLVNPVAVEITEVTPVKGRHGSSEGNVVMMTKSEKPESFLAVVLY